MSAARYYRAAPGVCMEVRIIKRPPAPQMDGFDVRALEVGRVYVVDERLGVYLVTSGYAETVTPLRARDERRLEDV